MSGTPGSPKWLLSVVLAGFFMYGFDGNVVNVALPSLQRDLHAGPIALELVVGGYVFAYAAMVVTGGRLGDLFGQRRLFLAGIAGFTLASALCALAQDPAELVTARVMQGLAAAAMVPQVLAIITVTFTATERAKALTGFAIVGGVSGICGQVLGGVLLDSDVAGLGWRSIFLINIPVGAAVLLAAWRLIPATDTRQRPSLDGVGVLAISGALALALGPLVIGRDVGWPVWTWLLIAASAPAMTLGLLWERHVTRLERTPLVDLNLFRIPGFTPGLAANAAFMGCFLSSIFVFSLTFQNGLGLSPLRAGAAFTPMAVMAIAVSLIVPRVVPGRGPRLLLVGALVSASGMLIAAIALNQLGGRISVIWLAMALAVVGAGNGMILPTLIGTPMTHVRPDQAGSGAGLLSTVQQFSGVAGIAVVGAAFFAVLGSHPNRADYASAAQAAAWIGLAILIALAGLTHPLARAAAQQPASIRDQLDQELSMPLRN